MWKSHASWAQLWASCEGDFSRPSSRSKVLMGGPLYSEGTGLLLAGAAVFIVGFFVFCCIDHCWLRRDLRKADRWSIFPTSSSNSNSADSDSTFSPWNQPGWREMLTDISSNSNSASDYTCSSWNSQIASSLDVNWWYIFKFYHSPRTQCTFRSTPYKPLQKNSVSPKFCLSLLTQSFE